MDEFDSGFLIGLLVGEGHFGGDGKAPHVIVRMHTRHERTFGVGAVCSIPTWLVGLTLCAPDT